MVKICKSFRSTHKLNRHFICVAGILFNVKYCAGHKGTRDAEKCKDTGDNEVIFTIPVFKA